MYKKRININIDCVVIGGSVEKCMCTVKLPTMFNCNVYILKPRITIITTCVLIN